MTDVRSLPTMFWPDGPLDTRPRFFDDVNLHRLGMVLQFFGRPIYFN